MKKLTIAAALGKSGLFCKCGAGMAEGTGAPLPIIPIL